MSKKKGRKTRKPASMGGVIKHQMDFTPEEEDLQNSERTPSPVSLNSNPGPAKVSVKTSAKMQEKADEEESETGVRTSIQILIATLVAIGGGALAFYLLTS